MGGLVRENALLFGVSAFLITLLFGAAAYLYATPAILMAGGFLLGMQPFGLGVFLTILASIVTVAVAAAVIVGVSLLATYLVDQLVSVFRSKEPERVFSSSAPAPGEESVIEREKKLNSSEMLKRLGKAKDQASTKENLQVVPDSENSLNMKLKKSKDPKATEALRALLMLSNLGTVTDAHITKVYDTIPQDLRSDFVSELKVLVPNHQSARDTFMNLIQSANNSTLVDNIDGISMDDLLGMADYVPPELTQPD